MLTVLKLEMPIVHACNLQCEGCTHYSNYGLDGVLALADGESALRTWGARVQPLHFSILGGEPLLHPQLVEYLVLARAVFPDARLRLVTNGLALVRARSVLWEQLAQTRTTLTISVHSRDAAYVARLEPAVALAREASTRAGFELELRDSIAGWYRPYLGEGFTMKPYADGQPTLSWHACTSRHCVTLMGGALWKCPPLAHLPRVAARFDLADDPAWRPYLEVRPLLPEATDDELLAFFAAGPEPCCGMCPAHPTFFEKQVLRRPARAERRRQGG
jgi:hypothetical protein